MAAKRGRTITSFGQFFASISGAQEVARQPVLLTVSARSANLTVRKRSNRLTVEPRTAALTVKKKG